VFEFNQCVQSKAFKNISTVYIKLIILIIIIIRQKYKTVVEYLMVYKPFIW